MGMILQQIIAAASQNNTAFFLSQILNDLSLKTEQIAGGNIIVIIRRKYLSGLHLFSRGNHLFPSDSFICQTKQALMDAADIRGTP